MWGPRPSLPRGAQLGRDLVITSSEAAENFSQAQLADGVFPGFARAQSRMFSSLPQVCVFMTNRAVPLPEVLPAVRLVSFVVTLTFSVIISVGL